VTIDPLGGVLKVVRLHFRFLLVICVGVSFSAFAVSLSNSVSVQPTELIAMSLEELMSVEVNVAGHTPMVLSDIPVTTRVIPKEMIRNVPYRSLVDALKFEPGIRTSQPGNGWDGDLFLMRGLKGNYYSKILLDGIPIAPSVTSGMPLGEQLFVQGADRVEILYGAASALYGADAIAGVINIVPYEPDTPEFRAGTMFGTEGYERYYFDAHYPVSTIDGEPVWLDLYGLFSQREDTDIKDGYADVYDRAQYGSANAVPFAFGDIPSKDWSFGVKLRYRGLKLMYDRMYRADHSSLGQHTDAYLYDDESAIIGETIDRFAAKHTHEGDRVTVRSTLSYLRYRLDPNSYFSFIYPLLNPANFGLRNNNYKYQASDDIFWEEVLQYELTDHWFLSAGFSAQYSKNFPKSNDLEEPFDEDDYSFLGGSSVSPDPIFGTFGQNEFTFQQTGLFGESRYHSDRFDLQVGLRYDSNSEYGDSLTYRAAGQLHVTEDTDLRLSYGTAYKAPSGYLAYNSVASVSAGGKINYITVPSPGLKPEKSQTLELGVRHSFTPHLMLDVSTYVTEIEDIIGQERIALDTNLYPNAANAITRTSINRDGTQRIYGLQAVLSAEDLVESIGLDSSVSVDYITGESVLPSGNGTVGSILMSPEWMLKWRVKMEPIRNLELFVDQMLCSSWKSFNVATQADYDDPYYEIAGYYLMDLSANYRLSEHTILFAQLQNVFDEKHGGIDAYGSGNLRYNPQTGRSFYVGVEVRY
jgi:hemoglobin/transferrin/lactoferrin receptor protein